MSEENQNTPEDLAAFRLIQKLAMEGEDTWEGFQRRVAALRVIAQRLDLARTYENETGCEETSADAEEESND